MHRKIPKPDVAHLSCESDPPCKRRLIERNAASERGLERTARAPFDVIQNKRLKENIDLVADAVRDVHIRPAVECGGAIIRVEKIDAESGNRESFGLAGPKVDRRR